jgi:hypothetical protein
MIPLPESDVIKAALPLPLWQYGFSKPSDSRMKAILFQSCWAERCIGSVNNGNVTAHE